MLVFNTDEVERLVYPGRAPRGEAIRARDGWELADAGKLHLKTIGVTKVSPAAS